MPHMRTQIRDLLETQVTGIAGVQSVWKNRVNQLNTSQLPAINITTADETIQRDTMDKSQRRVLQANFDVITEGGEDSADQLDEIIAGLEARLVAGAWSEALIFDIEVSQITEVFDGEGRKIAGQSRVSAAVEYHTQEGAPNAPIS